MERLDEKLFLLICAIAFLLAAFLGLVYKI